MYSPVAQAPMQDQQFNDQDMQRLVSAAQAGCEESFRVLVDRYHGQVLRYLARHTNDRELAADLTQETFLDAFRHLDRYQADRPFVAWLYRIAHYNLLHERRKQRIRQWLSLDWLIEQAGDAHGALHQPDAIPHLHERTLIRQTLEQLSPTLRVPLLLYSVGGFSSQEVAAMLAIAPAAVRQRVARAKAQFRQHYGVA